MKQTRQLAYGRGCLTEPPESKMPKYFMGMGAAKFSIFTQFHSFRSEGRGKEHCAFSNQEWHCINSHHHNLSNTSLICIYMKEIDTRSPIHESAEHHPSNAAYEHHNNRIKTSNHVTLFLKHEHHDSSGTTKEVLAANTGCTHHTAPRH